MKRERGAAGKPAKAETAPATVNADELNMPLYGITFYGRCLYGKDLVRMKHESGDLSYWIMFQLLRGLRR